MDMEQLADLFKKREKILDAIFDYQNQLTKIDNEIKSHVEGSNINQKVARSIKSAYESSNNSGVCGRFNLCGS